MTSWRCLASSGPEDQARASQDSVRLGFHRSEVKVKADFVSKHSQESLCFYSTKTYTKLCRRFIFPPPPFVRLIRFDARSKCIWMHRTRSSKEGYSRGHSLASGQLLSRNRSWQDKVLKKKNKKQKSSFQRTATCNRQEKKRTQQTQRKK